ncbi:hypothetical protein [Microbacterium sp. 22296]|uniref:hypothetical protein n=1 Tax=Microbacterium sp. 22296 TaxID=3453903 RepID=UPI003F8517CF
MTTDALLSAAVTAYLGFPKAHMPKADRRAVVELAKGAAMSSTSFTPRMGVAFIDTQTGLFARLEQGVKIALIITKRG